MSENMDRTQMIWLEYMPHQIYWIVIPSIEGGAWWKVFVSRGADLSYLAAVLETVSSWEFRLFRNVWHLPHQLSCSCSGHMKFLFPICPLKWLQASLGLSRSRCHHHSTDSTACRIISQLNFSYKLLSLRFFSIAMQESPNTPLYTSLYFL